MIERICHSPPTSSEWDQNGRLRNGDLLKTVVTPRMELLCDGGAKYTECQGVGLSAKGALGGMGSRSIHAEVGSDPALNPMLREG